MLDKQNTRILRITLKIPEVLLISIFDITQQILRIRTNLIYAPLTRVLLVLSKSTFKVVK